MKTIFAAVGAIVLVLSLLGAVGIGNFQLYYGRAPMTCAKGEA